MHDTLHKLNNRFLPVGYVVILALIAIIGWHLYLTNWARQGVDGLLSDRSLSSPASISINPATNLVSITIEMESAKDDSNPFVSFGDGLLKVAIQLIGPGALEHQLNIAARERYDLYAILVPYKVKIVTGEVDPESAARFQAERDKKRHEETRIKKEEKDRKQKAMRSYISSNLALEGLRVEKGSQFGREVTGVFGTIVNNGDKALNEVQLRIYFLNAKGERIGEKDYYPVLVSKFSLGLADQSPLRPRYRKDFGYSVEKDAPSGWSKKIEAEIMEIAFDEAQSDSYTKKPNEQGKTIQVGPPVVPPTARQKIQQKEDSTKLSSKSKSQTDEEINKLLPTLSDPVVPPPEVPSDRNDVLKRAEEALTKSPSAAASKPAAPARPLRPGRERPTRSTSS